MHYDLYFGAIKIGVVTEKDSDFPNYWGTITYDKSLVQATCNDERNRLLQFLELNREQIRLVDIEHEQDVSEELEAINQKLDEFSDYIETGGWLLIDETGHQLPILVPLLRHEREIVWRWNPEK